MPGLISVVIDGCANSKYRAIGLKVMLRGRGNDDTYNAILWRACGWRKQNYDEPK